MDKTKIILLASALISGSINTLGYTLQNKQAVNEGNVHKHFFHPYMQVAMRFFSNLLSLLLYFVLQHQEGKRKLETEISQQEPQQGDKQTYPKASLLLYIIPTVLDYVSTICYYTALNFIPGSVYQILRGGTVLTTFLFSYTCLHSRPTRFKIIGCIIVLLGLIGVGLVNFLFSTSTASQQQFTLIGYALILVALFGNGLHFVYQEHLMTKYNAKPLFIVGMQGVYGMFISFVLIPLLGLAPCHFGVQACVYQQSGNAVVEDISVYFAQVFSNGLILTGVLLVWICTAIYNSLGVKIAKQMNSLTRSICDASRTVIVWVVGIIITACSMGDKSFQWQSLNAWQLLGETLCFGILIVGNLVYYGIIECKILESQQKNETLIEQDQCPSITTQS